METKKRQDTFYRESLLFSRKGEKNIAPCPRTACRQTCRLRPTAVWEVRTPPAAESKRLDSPTKSFHTKDSDAETKKRQDTFHRESLLFSKRRKNTASCPRTACRQTCRLQPTAVWEVRTPPAARANASTLQQSRSAQKTATREQKRGKMLCIENRSFSRKGEKRPRRVRKPHIPEATAYRGLGIATV